MKKDKFRNLLETSWTREGEQIRTLLGGEGNRGYLGATIGGRNVVPLVSSRAGEDLKVDFGEMRAPSQVVRDGRFHGDEWLHDPALRGWVSASSPDQLAAQCADRIAAAGPHGWYVMSDERVAVVVEAGVVGKLDGAGAAAAADENEQEKASKGFGKFFDRARSAVSAVTELSENFKPGSEAGAAPITLWECSYDRVAERQLVSMGRLSRGYNVSRCAFVDGSTLLVRSDLST